MKLRLNYFFKKCWSSLVVLPLTRRTWCDQVPRLSELSACAVLTLSTVQAYYNTADLPAQASKNKTFIDYPTLPDLASTYLYLPCADSRWWLFDDFLKFRRINEPHILQGAGWWKIRDEPDMDHAFKGFAD